MMPGAIWLTKLVLSHLLTDFVLQPSSRVEDRQRKHFASGKLYLHVLLTALVAYMLIGWQYWQVALIILVTHFLIDGWKSYRPRRAQYFVIDQLLHLAVIAGCWLLTFGEEGVFAYIHRLLTTDLRVWIVSAGFVFVTSPAGILIGQLTSQWSNKINDPENSLANAGKWIGMVERVIVVILVLQNQYSAIGLLVAAKGIIRFNEKDRQEVKTEYLVIGTLMSIGVAILTGLLVKMLIAA
jgi:hypothetical protein